jgi:hypothetical protein
MASRIAEAYVQIVPRIDGLAKGINSQLSSQMAGAGNTAGTNFGNGFAGRLKALAGPAIAAVAVVAAAKLGKFFASTIKDASNFEAEFEGVNQVFGEAAKSVQDFAQNAARTAGLGATEALQAAKTFGLFGKSAGLGVEEAAKFSTTLVQLAGDLGSFNDVPTPEALAAIQSGLMGQAEPLRKFGIFLTDDALRQQIFADTGERVTGVLSAQQKMMASYALIMSSTAIQQGDFVKYQDTFGNATKTVSEEFQNAKNAIGLAFLPAAAQVAVFIRDNLLPAFSNFANNLKENLSPEFWENLFANAGAFITGLKNVFGKAGGGIDGFLAVIMLLRQKLQDAFLAALPGIIDAIVKFIPILIENTVLMITKLIEALVQALPQIVEGAIVLFNGIVEGLIKILPVIINAVVEAIPVIVAALIRALPIIIQGAIQLFIGIVEGLTKALPLIIRAIVNALPMLIETIVDALPMLIDAAIELFLGLVDGLIIALPEIIDAVIDAIPQIVEAIIDAIPQLIDAGFQLIGGLIEGIIEAGPRVLDAIGQVIGDGIDWAKNLLGIKSPSTVFAGFGRNVIKGLEKGLLAGENSIRSTMGRVSKWVKDSVKSGDLSKSGAVAARALVKSFRKELLNLQREYDAVLVSLGLAQDDLADRLDAKASLVSSISDKYGVAGLVGEDAAYEDVVKTLQDKISKSKELKTLGDKLLTLGLDEGLYKQIIESGAFQFAEQIVIGGQQAVDELNVLAKEASAEAIALADRVGAVLFDEGIAFAESVVSGLVSKKTELEELMKSVANAFSVEIQALIASSLAVAKQGQTSSGSAEEKTYKGTRPGPDIDGRKKGQIFEGANNTWKWDGKEWDKLPKLAKGGFITGPTTALIGEAGPELVVPLNKFEQWMGLDERKGNTIVYNAAPNNSINSEQALFQAIKRARVLTAW